MPHRLDARRPDFAAAFADFLDLRRAREADVAGRVRGILAAVAAGKRQVSGSVMFFVAEIGQGRGVFIIGVSRHVEHAAQHL